MNSNSTLEKTTSNPKEIDELKNYFLLEKTYYRNDGNEVNSSVLGVLSSVLEYTEIALSDDANFLKKFPNGAITENIIAIPTTKWEQFRNEFSSLRKTDYVNFSLRNDVAMYGLLLADSLLKVLENSMKISLPKFERERVFKHVINVSKPTNELLGKIGEMSLVNFVKSMKLDFAITSNQELYKFLTYSNSLKTIASNYSLNHVDELKKSLTMNSEIEKFATLKLISQANQFKYEETDFNLLIKETSQGKNALNKPINVIRKLVFDNYRKSSGKVDEFIAISKSNLFLSLKSLPTRDFTLAIACIRKKFNEDQDSNELNNTCEKLAHAINAYTTEKNRSNLTYVITGYEMICGLHFSNDELYKNKKVEQLEKEVARDAPLTTKHKGWNILKKLGF